MNQNLHLALMDSGGPCAAPPPPAFHIKAFESMRVSLDKAAFVWSLFISKHQHAVQNISRRVQQPIPAPEVVLVREADATVVDYCTRPAQRTTSSLDISARHRRFTEKSNTTAKGRG